MTRYNIDLLNEIITRDLCTIDLIPENLNIGVRIPFTCSCEEKGIKVFRQLFVAGAYCKTCTLKKRKEKRKNTCLEKYGVENIFSNKEVQLKIKKTCLEKYGVENPTQSKQTQEKKKKTCLEKYGVEHATQSKQTQEKKKNTCLEKYGVECPLSLKETQEKKKKTCLDIYGVEYATQSKQTKLKYKETCLKIYGVTNISKSQDIKNKKVVTCLINNGVTNPSKSKEIQDKKVITCNERYGTDNALQNPEILEKTLKSRYQFKTFIYPDGDSIRVQGYEPWALQELVDEGFRSDEIITDKKEVPEIWYNDENNTKRRYFVDIYIPKINKMIEVKSTWTIKSEKDKIIEKAKECIKQGYDYQIWIYTDKKIKQIITEF